MNPVTYLARKHHLLGLTLFLALTLSGCTTFRGTPDRYQETNEIVTKIELTAQDMASLALTTDRTERNHLQKKALAVIDLRYNAFVRSLAADRADSSAGLAGTTLGASTAGAFVDSVKAKTNYALFGAATIGAFSIVDKNYYYEKTITALVAGMRAARATVLLRIRQRQVEEIESYDGASALQMWKTTTQPAPCLQPSSILQAVPKQKLMRPLRRSGFWRCRQTARLIGARRSQMLFTLSRTTLPWRKVT